MLSPGGGGGGGRRDDGQEQGVSDAVGSYWCWGEKMGTYCIYLGEKKSHTSYRVFQTLLNKTVT